MYDIMEILRVMPHRYPFLMVDKIVEVSEEKVVGIKNVTVNEPHFMGHFPENPVMPGVLIVEAMAQTGGFLILQRIESPENKLVYFARIDKVKFRKPVRPGDVLRMELTFKGQRRNLYMMEGKTYVDGEVVAEGEFTAAVVER
ncbi:3-hydroxyacyl-[acyl-carrier-protein] dehydratase FabZ [bacterium]|nr:MAG: 3-hydroxyacyl-[acyl-carrier-protein] dehydratase FabZ [bacterium]